MLKKILHVVGLMVLLIGSPVWANANSPSHHELLRRISVFPIFTAAEEAPVATEVWWKLRETLTQDRRFLIASKHFMAQKGVFQPRKSLKPADAVILGSLLEAQGLMTLYLDERKLHLSVYDGQRGTVLWTHATQLHPSVKIADQLENIAIKMVKAFMASVPYQGYQIVDPLIGPAVYIDAGKQYARVEVGTLAYAKLGEPAQWIQIEQQNMNPLFQGGGKISVYAEGKIVKAEPEAVTIEIIRIKPGAKLQEFSLVHFPREYERLQQEHKLEGEKTESIPELLVTQDEVRAKETKDDRRLLTVLSMIGNAIAFILIAF